MNGNEQIFPFQKLSALLAESAESSVRVISYFNDFQFQLDDTSKSLSEMQNTLEGSICLLERIAVEEVTVSQLLDYFDWIQEGRKEFYQLFGGLQTFEPILLHLMEIIEEEFQGNDEEKFRNQLSVLFDKLEHISDALVDTKPVVRSVKKIFDTAIEFNEIFKEHMNSLDLEIENNFRMCLEIQESNFSSPVRHNKPIYSLDQLVTMLSSNHTPGKDIQLPISSSIERSLRAKFLELTELVGLVEMSLTSVLQQRVENFGNHDISNIEYLRRLLQNKFKELLKKYEFLRNELAELKYVLIDQKWEIIFDNLNDELRSMLKDIEKLVDKVENQGISEEIRGKYRQQLRKKGETVDKTFGIIYRAIESSLLSERIAVTTNEQADKWLQLKEKCESTLPEEETPSEDLNITADLASLKLTDAPSEKPSSNRSSIGALLSRKMNIKPVLVKDDNNQLENPFYDLKEKGQKINELNFSLVPNLSFETRKKTVLEQHQLFNHYLSQKTNIPGGEHIPHKRSILFKFNPNWNLRPHHQLRPPTIMTS